MQQHSEVKTKKNGKETIHLKNKKTKINAKFVVREEFFVNVKQAKSNFFIQTVKQKMYLQIWIDLEKIYHSILKSNQVTKNKM